MRLTSDLLYVYCVFLFYHESILFEATSPIVLAPLANKSPSNEEPIVPSVPSNEAIEKCI